jgi:hypothetical protein
VTRGLFDRLRRRARRSHIDTESICTPIGTPAREPGGTRLHSRARLGGPGRSGPRRGAGWSPPAGRHGPAAARPLGHGPQQLDRLPLGHPGRPRRLAAGCRDPGRAGGDPGLGGGQAAAGEQGEPMTVGGQLDQGVQAGQQPAVREWHGDPFGSVDGSWPEPATPPRRLEEARHDLWTNAHPRRSRPSPTLCRGCTRAGQLPGRAVRSGMGRRRQFARSASR